MPILGYETYRQRKYLDRAIQKARIKNPKKAQKYMKPDSNDPNFVLVQGYFNNERPLHCRRTLDQFSYQMTHSTEQKDLNQMTYRWAGEEKKDIPAKFRPLVMVDQLWLWILHDGCTP